MIILIRWLYRRLRARRAAGRPDTANSPAGGQRSPPGGRNGPLDLVAHQVRYNLTAFRRNRQGVFSTMLFPVIFLVLFVGVFGNHTVGAGHVKASTYYVPGIAALAVVTSSFANLVITITTQRETGILRRRRSTPIPAWVLIAAQTLTTMLVSLVGVAVLLIIGQVAYGVTLQASAIPGMVLTTVAGSIAFSCLAYALSTAIGSADSATPTVQAIILPLYFISGVFIPNASLPPWLQDVARAFPVGHLASGLHHAFDPGLHGSAVPWTDIAILAAWATAGLILALRRFTWSPSAAMI